ncbi:Retinol dehydrogenase 10-B [Eumeta japonica]|uniref:Retinol dehydrogenase 10-B n=1 Tax=Eumeta variegata TaxID=151549 RepID=A0A4C1VNN2_EUMVA|nr:Retinol dehydrogenase 10-B [Eumeta japonica]
MAPNTQEYMDGMRPGPLTSEIPECMRDKYTIIQSALDFIVFLLTCIGQIIYQSYRWAAGTPKKDLRGGIAVVTGGGGGLGSLIALRLARLGCTVVLWDINKKDRCANARTNVAMLRGHGRRCRFKYLPFERTLLKPRLCLPAGFYLNAVDLSQRVGKSSTKLRFHSGNFDIKDALRSGRSVTDKADAILKKVELDQDISSHYITEKLGIDHKTILPHLKKAGYTKELDT